MGLESRIINSDNFRIMNIKKVGVAIEYCTYDKMKAKNEVSQGWSEWGDLAFLSKEKDIETYLPRICYGSQGGFSANAGDMPTGDRKGLQNKYRSASAPGYTAAICTTNVRRVLNV